jgi:hypothetical protein
LLRTALRDEVEVDATNRSAAARNRLISLHAEPPFKICSDYNKPTEFVNSRKKD